MPSFVVMRPDGEKVDITDNIKNALGEDDVREALVGTGPWRTPSGLPALAQREPIQEQSLFEV